MTPFEQMAYEALIGWQHDCEAMMNLTLEERNSISKSVAEALRTVHDEALEKAANIVWANRWEPPYTVENRTVEQIRALKEKA